MGKGGSEAGGPLHSVTTQPMELPLETPAWYSELLPLHPKGTAEEGPQGQQSGLQTLLSDPAWA